MLSLAATHAAVTGVHGEWLGQPRPYAAVGTDSRKLQPDELFVALRGEHFDGHDFVADVLARGAAAAVVDRAWTGRTATQPLLLVDDTRLAYGQIAAAWRRQFSLPLIGVVGSNGKTTVKEMIAAILVAQHGEAHCLATSGNLNNDVGVPAMLLRLNPQHRAAVIEMGMNHPGETALLAGWAQPTVGIINNAQREHQEFMKTVDAVAEEHAALFDALPANGTAVINADDGFKVFWQKRAQACPVVTFGFAPDADVRGTLENGALRIRAAQGEALLQLAVLGEHNMRNALGAAAATLAAGCSFASVVRGLENFRPVKGRLQRFTGRYGGMVIDDTYNANPDSVRAAIDVLAQAPAPRYLVLGDMGEVGDQGEAYHAEVGAYAAACGIEQLLTLGRMSAAASAAFGAAARHFDALDALLAAITALAAQPDSHATILVKGSRFMRMERVVEALIQTTPDTRGNSHVA